MSDYNKFWQKVYDVAATSSQEEYEKVLYPSAADELLQRALVHKLLAKRIKGKGKKLADVGCGTGRYFNDLEQMGFEIMGCDYSWNLLRHAKTQKKGGLLQAEAENLPYRPNTFDVVISIGVLQTVVDYKKGMDEVYRILKPGGVLIISTLRRPVIWELPFMPVVELFMYDYSMLSGQWYHKLIGDRTGLSWHNRPHANRAKRFNVSDIKNYLHGQGFTDIRHCYLGRLKHIPILLNSQIITFRAVKI
jgi:ubiquinone/menaquinone biosynthesis C-methylase UbiE